MARFAAVVQQGHDTSLYALLLGRQDDRLGKTDADLAQLAIRDVCRTHGARQHAIVAQRCKAASQLALEIEDRDDAVSLAGEVWLQLDLRHRCAWIGGIRSEARIID